MKLSRRGVLQCTLAGTVLPLCHSRLYATTHPEFAGRFCVFVQAAGGLDWTSFCDPKTNITGERVTNNWATNNEVQQAGNIPYAPFGSNQAFFEKFYERMLVINGVDLQSDSHNVGTTHSWSGQNSAGFPATTALYASVHSPDHPMAYLNFGGYVETGGLVRATRVANVDVLREVLNPNTFVGREELTFLPEDDFESIVAFASQAAEEKANLSTGTGRARELARHYGNSLQGSERLLEFGNALQEIDIQATQDQAVSSRGHVFGSELPAQAQTAVLAFKSGVAVAADLRLGGFDTHENHDEEHGIVLGFLTQGLDLLWEYAEEAGVADRLFVVIGSECGRTNFYNEVNGKDHWPIGSYVIMEKNQAWTNRVVGSTDEHHYANKIDPVTLADDTQAGTILYPRHVHKALRSHLELLGTAGAKQFPFIDTEDLTLFKGVEG